MVLGKVRMRALTEFTRRVDNTIIHGNPDHPDDEGKYPLVTEAAAVELEDEDLAERFSHQDQAREEAQAEKEGRGKPPEGGKSETLTDTSATNGRKTAQQVRETRTDRTTGANGRRRTTGKGPGGKGGAPAGGHDTNATTNNGPASTTGTGTTAATNAGATSDPDPDAPPVD
jgi:hypothetical protein